MLPFNKREIGFGNKNDSFHKEQELAPIFGNDYKLNSEQLRGITDAFSTLTEEQRKKKVNIKDFSFLGDGCTATCYKKEGFELGDKKQDIVIKVLRDKEAVLKITTYDPPEQVFNKEMSGLKEREKINLGDSQRLIAGFEHNGRYYTVSTLVKGERPDVINNPMEKTHLEQMLGYCAEMDRIGLTHYDLQAGNFLIDGKNLSLIDFGGAGLCNPDEFFNTPKDHWVFKFSNMGDNPFYVAPLNASNFEHRALNGYMEKLAEKNPKEAKNYFTEYLKSKSSEYHPKLAEFLNSLKPRNFRHLDEAIEHERLSSRVLSKPTENVIKAELLKMQLRNLIHNDKDYYAEQIQEFYNQATKLVGSMAEGANGEEKKYLQSCHDLFKNFAQAVKGVKSGSNNIRSEELPINTIFGTIINIAPKNSTKNEVSETISNAAKNSKSMLISIGAIALITITGIGYYFTKKSKKQEENSKFQENNYREKEPVQTIQNIPPSSAMSNNPFVFQRNTTADVNTNALTVQSQATNPILQNFLKHKKIPC